MKRLTTSQQALLDLLKMKDKLWAPDLPVGTLKTAKLLEVTGLVKVSTVTGNWYVEITTVGKDR